MPYKAKSAVGPWAAGEIFTDAQLKQYPGLGGIERLRKLDVVEDVDDAGTSDGKDPPSGRFSEVFGKKGDSANATDAGNRSPELATGHDQPHVVKGDAKGHDDPNAASHARRGKS